MTKSSNSLGEIWISSGERLFPEPQIRILHKLLQSPAWSWNKRQWIKPNNFQPLLWIYISYYLAKKLPRDYKWLNCHCITELDNTAGSGGVTAVIAFNPTHSTCTPVKGQGWASILYLFLGRPETDAFTQVCAVMRRTTVWNVERGWNIMSGFLSERKTFVFFSVSWTLGLQMDLRVSRKLRFLFFSSTLSTRVFKCPEDSETGFNFEHNLLKGEV